MPARRNTRSPRSPAFDVEPLLFRVGEVLADRYEIREVLGTGGMGQVFDAHDRTLNRRVALKAHWPHLREFPIRREARALAAIRHPAVVTVHTVERHFDTEFMVMERVLGANLGDVIERRRARGPFPIDEAIALLLRLAEGLQAVHDAGIAHRDVKPGNILLSARNRLVLTDFGIFQPEFESGLSDDGAGTAEYMAPEALSGTVSRGGAYLLDVYAFGVVAFELLTGRRPFVGNSLHQVVETVLRDPAPAVASLRPDAPPRLSALIDAALRKDPAERPASMDQIAATLRAPTTAEGPRRPMSVLIAEDERAIADVLEEFVADVAPDAEVRVARDGDAVLAHVRQACPDLLLLDIGLPSMNGVELCMYLRGAHLADATSIVALSAAAQPRDIALLRQLGIRTFIRKGDGWLDRVEAAILHAQASHARTTAA